MTTATLNYSINDIHYLRHGDRAMRLRLFRPTGSGPFPLMLDLHGGCWTKGELGECEFRDALLCEAGIAAAALDFRHGADGYPSSLVDINYAVRWLKAHAEEWRIDPYRIGIVGQSSGGHLAMLSAMRPYDPRYTAIPLDEGAPSVDATVHCVGMMWPVINPLSRYRHALRSRGGTSPAGWVADIPERQELYWGSEAAMAEGNPELALEKGEVVTTPPALWVQGRPDTVHDYRDPESPLDLNEPERFAANYRKAGGHIEIAYIDQDKRMTATSVEPLVGFLQQHLT